MFFYIHTAMTLKVPTRRYNMQVHHYIGSSSIISLSSFYIRYYLETPFQAE